MLSLTLMKKKDKEADVPDLFRIKQPQADAQQIKDSWDAIAQKLNKPGKKKKQ